MLSRVCLRHPALVKITFISYIRPILKFDSNIWNPTKEHLKDKLGKILSSFTISVPSIFHLRYLERLRVL